MFKKNHLAGVNKVILVGNLGKDPEVRYLDSGIAVANISIATTENYKNKNGDRVSQTEWHDVVLWRGLAEVAEKYLNSGNYYWNSGIFIFKASTYLKELERYEPEIYSICKKSCKF